MTAIILGATGLTGSLLLELLLKDSFFNKVVVITRKETKIDHPKIEEHLVGMLSLDEHERLFRGNVVFCCIGTTRAKTPDKEIYRMIDYGIPVSAAQLAAKNGVFRFIVMSSTGADEKSYLFYNRTKGEMERDVLKANIANTFILRPSLIIGKRNEKRKGEQTAALLMTAMTGIMPKNYRPIKASDIAKAMVWLAKNDFEDNIISSVHIKDIAKKTK